MEEHDDQPEPGSTAPERPAELREKLADLYENPNVVHDPPPVRPEGDSAAHREGSGADERITITHPSPGQTADGPTLQEDAGSAD